MQLKEKFEQLKKEGRGAFIAYVPFGFPTPAKSKEIILSLQRAGADIIELGLPFSDPLADGPIIQAACHDALAAGADAQKMFMMLKDIRGKIKIPLVVMTYLNPVLQYGTEKFFAACAAGGIAGMMLVDSPIEENKNYMRRAAAHGITTVCFVTPVTPPPRIKKIAAVSSGFIYYISVTGVTGPRALKFYDIKKHIRMIRRFSDIPVCVGFGIHERGQIEQLSRISDGAIVGSAIVKFIARRRSDRDLLPQLERYVSSLCPR